MKFFCRLLVSQLLTFLKKQTTEAMFIYRINFSYLHTGIVISCSWYNPYFFISVPNDTVRCNNSTSTPKEMSISDMQMKQPTNISRLMQLCLPLLLCALGNVSNMKGKRRSKLPLEERGDAKLLHLSPRRHSPQLAGRERACLT